MSKIFCKVDEYVRVGDSTLTITGNIESISSIAVSGKILGNITVAKATAVINADCQVTGDIIADTVIVHGFVRGNIKANTTAICEDGAITGDVDTGIIRIDEGGVFNGACKTADKQTTDTPPDK